MKLKCITCGKEFTPVPDRYTCEVCGPFLGTLEVVYDYERMKVTKETFMSGKSIFQFKDLLPVKSHTPMDFSIGNTPLFRFNNKCGLDTLLVKFDGVSPSGSFKDRASIIALNLAIELGAQKIFCASTGNAASSLSILSAHSDLTTEIFVPVSAPIGKLAQLAAAGANLHLIKGSYDDAFDVSMKVGLSNGWYCRNSAINPYLTEGKKTGAYEVLVQNNYKVPDFCFVGVGDGTVVSSLIKGFEEFKHLGLVDRVPIVVGVQAEGADAVKRSFENGPPFRPVSIAANTIADSISVGNPRDVVKACQYMARNGGAFISVSDDEIKTAIVELTRETGVFAEPAGAIAFAGFKKLMNQGRIHRSDSVVLIVTGNGLKDPSHLDVELPDAVTPEVVLEMIGG